jgi:hypothetical protein
MHVSLPGADVCALAIKQCPENAPKVSSFTTHILALIQYSRRVCEKRMMFYGPYSRAVESCRPTTVSLLDLYF